MPHSQYIIIQANFVRITEDQVEILQRLREPKTLHAVRMADTTSVVDSDVPDATTGNLGASGVFDGLEHTPCVVQELFITGDAIENEYRFYGLRAGFYQLLRQNKTGGRWRICTAGCTESHRYRYSREPVSLP